MIKINAETHPWEKIFQRDGRVLTELLPAFQESVDKFSNHHCRSILDLGCGNGRHLVGFAREGFSVTGLDISPTGLVLSRAWLEEEGILANLVQGDFRSRLPFQDQSFQGIFSTQVIHHALLEEIRFALQEVWRVLEIGGLAFITVAGGEGPRHKSREIEPGTYLFLEGDEKGLPHHVFDPAELRREFFRFEVLKLESRDDGRVLIVWARKPG